LCGLKKDRRLEGLSGGQGKNFTHNDIQSVFGKKVSKFLLVLFSQKGAR